MNPAVLFRIEVDGRVETLKRLGKTEPYYVGSEDELGSGSTAFVKRWASPTAR